MSDRNVLEAIVSAARDRRPAVLATVVRTRGSVPRHAGSRMLVEPGRGLVGTIGGGCGEAEVIAAADQVLASGRPRLLEVQLMDDVQSWSPAICGGVMEIFLEPVASSA
jgi:xanthine dehydrogenase accessory factor